MKTPAVAARRAGFRHIPEGVHWRGTTHCILRVGSFANHLIAFHPILVVCIELDDHKYSCNDHHTDDNICKHINSLLRIDGYVFTHRGLTRRSTIELHVPLATGHRGTWWDSNPHTYTTENHGDGTDIE